MGAIAIISPIIGLIVTIITTIFLILRFGRETKDRLRSDKERSDAYAAEMEKRGFEEGQRKAREDRMDKSINNAWDKIRKLESEWAADKQRQSESFMELNSKLDQMTAIMNRMEGEILRRIERLEDRSE